MSPVPHRPTPGRRLLAALAFLFGGLGAEAVQPGPCQLICNNLVRRRDPPGE